MTKKSKILSLDSLDKIEVPTIRLTKSLNGSTGTITFFYKNNKVFQKFYLEKTPIYKIKLESHSQNLISTDTKIIFKYGNPISLAIFFVLKNPKEWEFFQKFIIDYSKKNQLHFLKSKIL